MPTVPELWLPVPLRVSSARTPAIGCPRVPMHPGPAAINSLVCTIVYSYLLPRRKAGQLLL